MDGLYGPESALYDEEQDVFFISCMLGPGSAKDGAGYIVRVSASDLERSTIFAQGGVRGVRLDAPKGMAIVGDTLWVADIDVLRALDRRTGTPLAELDLRAQGAVMLNDIARAPDGSLRVTDSGIRMTEKGVLHPGGDKLFAISGGVARIIAQGEQLGRPNGIAWDSAGSRWLIVSFDPFKSELYAIPDLGFQRSVLSRGRGKYDGVVVLRGGSVLLSSWSDSSIHRIVGERDDRIIRGLIEPADFSLDTRRGRVMIPLVGMGRVELWTIPHK
jgi:sugar lactone lactonase YvrE